jgi:hypothetical protein
VHWLRLSHFRVFIVMAAISGLALGGCRANLGGQERSGSEPAQEMTAKLLTPPAPVMQAAHVENDIDRAVHMELDHAFSDDPNLKGQNIIFVVDEGDVRLTGTVKTEKQREKANEVAINVAGVRSVANLLRVSP